MGSGKSTLVRRWRTNEPNFSYFDLDDEIYRRKAAQFKNLGEYIENVGWERFRQDEHQVLAELLSVPGNAVISLGGGALQTQSNRELIASHAENILVWLNTPFETCWQRIRADHNRPLVKKGRRVLLDLYQERLSHYQAAKVILDNKMQQEVNSPRDLPIRSHS